MNDGRVIPNFMKQALRGDELTIYGDGAQTRSFCYITLKLRASCAWHGRENMSR